MARRRKTDKTAEWLRSVYRVLHTSPSDEFFPKWRQHVEEIRVELQRGSRAVLHHPESPGLVVEIRFDPDLRWPREITWRAVPTQQAALRALVLPDGKVVPARVVPGRRVAPGRVPRTGDPILPAVQVDFSMYVAALGLELARKSDATGRASRKKSARPRSGTRPPLEFYEGLLNEFHERKAKGDKAPLKTLARRHGVVEGTMKSWLHRARRYTKGAS